MSQLYRNDVSRSLLKIMLLLKRSVVTVMKVKHKKFSSLEMKIVCDIEDHFRIILVNRLKIKGTISNVL